MFDPRQFSPTAVAAVGTFVGSIVGWVLAGRPLGQYDEPLRVGTMGGLVGVTGFVVLFGIQNGLGDGGFGLTEASGYGGFVLGVGQGLILAGPLLL
ncbi:MAG: hypothetical protein ABEI99_00445, partial [Halobaculum sp.]